MKSLVLALILIAAPTFGATPTDTTIAVDHGAPDRAATTSFQALIGSP